MFEGEMASGVLPTGADRVVFGSCLVPIDAPGLSFGTAECFDPRILNGDHVVATFNEFGDFGDFQIVLISITSHCDEEVSIDGHLCLVVENESNNAFDDDALLHYIAYGS